MTAIVETTEHTELESLGVALPPDQHPAAVEWSAFCFVDITA